MQINLSKPQFITFEGGEGCGKSTQSKLLHEYLLSKNIKSIHTREIGGTLEAEKIRHLIIYSDLEVISELMLIMAARYEHINKVIIPALLDDTWVICDRFIDSTACYQSNDSNLTIYDIYDLHDSLMRYLPKNDSERYDDNKNAVINMYKAKGIRPNITFFMDVVPQIGLNRATSRGDANKFEHKDLDFHNLVYSKFKKIASMHKDRIILIDVGSKSIDEIQEIVRSNIFSIT